MVKNHHNSIHSALFCLFLIARLKCVTTFSDTLANPLYTKLKRLYDTERQLLYVACTRARDHLLITSVVPASEFLDDLAAAALNAQRDSARQNHSMKLQGNQIA